MGINRFNVGNGDCGDCGDCGDSGRVIELINDGIMSFVSGDVLGELMASWVLAGWWVGYWGDMNYL
jgi:hypothetical protein